MSNIFKNVKQTKFQFSEKWYVRISQFLDMLVYIVILHSLANTV